MIGSEVRKHALCKDLGGRDTEEIQQEGGNRFCYCQDMETERCFQHRPPAAAIQHTNLGGSMVQVEVSTIIIIALLALIIGLVVGVSLSRPRL